MIQHLSHALVALAVIISAGCGTVNTVNTRTAPAETTIPYVTQVNDALSSLSLKAKDVRLVPTPGGVLKAQIDVANDDLRTRSFNYRVDWLDQSGTVIDAQTSVWQSRSVASGGMITISAVAPSPSATDFRMQVRASI